MKVYIVIATEGQYDDFDRRVVAAFDSEQVAWEAANSALAWRNHKGLCRATGRYPNPFDPDARYHGKTDQPEYSVEGFEVHSSMPLLGVR
jgi:hypothetical protein